MFRDRAYSVFYCFESLIIVRGVVMSEQYLKSGRGGERKGAGRPKGSGEGTKRVSFCVSCQPEELERLREIVAASGKSTSRFLLDLAFRDSESSSE